MEPINLLWAALIAVVATVIFLNVRGVAVRTGRVRRLAATANRHRWLYSEKDVFGLGAYDFALFDRGSVRGFENTVWGNLKGVPFQFADYWYSTEYEAEEPSLRLRTGTKDMSCVVIRMNAYVPRVMVDPESLSTWVNDPTDELDLQFESEEFNRRFRIQAHDRLFAYKLIVPSMMQWLLAMPDRYGVEIYKSALVVYAPRRDPSDMYTMVACATGVLDRIPKLVWREYSVSQEDAERYWA
jgi:hypothetical protein